MKFEDDGAIDETRFLSLVNEVSPKDANPFSKDEVDRHIEILGEQGKVMKSDGIIYMIDWKPILKTFVATVYLVPP